MNWYKLAESALNITPDQFQAMGGEEKRYLARSTRISPQTQRVFFTEKYLHKNYVLQYLATNPSIIPQTQRMFFTEDYWDKENILSYLAKNRSISPEVQRLFLTEEYEDKDNILIYLFRNPSFLKGLTPKEMIEFTKIKEARLLVYSKRFKDIRAMVLL